MNNTFKISLKIVAMGVIFNYALYSQNLVVNNDQNTVTINTTNEGAGFSANMEELTSGMWVLTNTETKILNGVNITKWETANNELLGITSWKDMLNIIHTIESGFKWQEPPKYMQPGTYMNLEAIYTNLDYSTTANINTGIRILIGRTGMDYLVQEQNTIDVLKLNKNSFQYTNEIKKGFFYAPKKFFDESNTCQLIIDCYTGKDHYLTIYTYTYQK